MSGADKEKRGRGRPPKSYAVEDVRCASATEVGRVFGISRQAVSEWSPGDARFKVSGETRFDLPSLIAWRIAEAVARVSGPDELEASKARKEAALAERAEIELGRIKRELVSVDEVVGFATEFANILRAAHEKQAKAYGEGCRQMVAGALARGEEMLKRKFVKEHLAADDADGADGD